MNLKKIIIITAAIPVIVIGYVTLPWTLMALYGVFLVPEPAKPLITQESFPFTLVYELDGEEKVIEDTMICKYAGSKWLGTEETKSRIWEMELASGNDAIVLWEGKTKKGKEQKVIWSASPEYYMGDVSDMIDYEYVELDEDAYLYPGMTEEECLHIHIEAQTTSSDNERIDIIRRKKLLKKYGIKIVSWECRQPIKNEFTKPWRVPSLWGFSYGWRTIPTVEL